MLAHHVVVDSKRRLDGGTSSNFHYRIELPPGRTYTRVVVTQLVLPVSFYMLTNSNNTFVLIENATQYTITMPPGNYTRSALLYQLALQMNAVATNVYTVVGRDTTTDPEDYKFVFSYTGTAPAYISQMTRRLSEMTGLSFGTTHQFINNELISDSTYSLAVEQSLFLISDCVADGQALSINLDNGIGAGTISRTSSDYAYDARDLRVSRGNVYSFRLVNEDGDPLDLNGQNMTLELMFF